MSLTGMAKPKGRPSPTPHDDRDSDDYEVSSLLSVVFEPSVSFSNSRAEFRGNFHELRCAQGWRREGLPPAAVSRTNVVLNAFNPIIAS